MEGVRKHCCAKRSKLLGRGNRERQTESECVALEGMLVVYLLQACASISNEYRPIFQRKRERERKIHKRAKTGTKIENEPGAKTEWRIGIRIKIVTWIEIKNDTETSIEAR
ncbi:hypothetical protein EVAR_48721_1 [Eumeta japonica]|uniref:Uncharacterized protein n=1 Tax=Eumeta variegata TaxID=151549 RepID=A0A4C1XAT5_EUMVA|nr:hypothetical protein EVAR_48721_1 [Eumeta japonica]